MELLSPLLGTVSVHFIALEGHDILTTIAGSSIQLQGNATNASYTISLDGVDVANPAADIADNVLATITDLPNAPHAITLTAQILDSDPTSSIAFGRAIIASTPPNPNPSTCVHFMAPLALYTDTVVDKSIPVKLP